MTGQLSLFSDRTGEVIPMFSECGRFRYRLDYRWAPGPTWVWMMLNPSVAGSGVERDNLDATLRKCRGFTERGGGGAFIVVNLFPFVGQDPAALWAAMDDGEDVKSWDINQDVIISAAGVAADSGGKLIVGWGAFSKAKARHVSAASEHATAAIGLLNRCGVRVQCMATNAGGTPSHPLYLPSVLTPKPFTATSLAASVEVTDG